MFNKLLFKDMFPFAIVKLAEVKSVKRSVFFLFGKLQKLHKFQVTAEVKQ